MRLMIDLPDNLRYVYETRANTAGVSLERIIIDALYRDASIGRRPVTELAEAVAGLVRGGMCDADIALELSVVPGYVASLRRRAGLPANRRYAKTQTNV